MDLHCLKKISVLQKTERLEVEKREMGDKATGFLRQCRLDRVSPCPKLPTFRTCSCFLRAQIKPEPDGKLLVLCCPS